MQKQQLATLNIAQYSSFVSPEHCEMLAQQGVKMESPVYQWIIINQHAHIRTSLYDYDGYYKCGQKLIDALHLPIQLTAYTSGMLEQVLPPYTLCKNACGNYEILCDKYYNANEVKAARLPDAMAMMLIQLLQLRRLTPEFVNNIFTHTR